MKIVVTGSKGQLGCEINDISVKYPGWEFLFVDIEELDLTDTSAVDNYMSAQKPQYVINCAAYTAVDKAEDEKGAAFAVNSEAPLHLGNASEKYNYRFLHISTDYVFSGEHFRPYKEEDPTDPKSVYGESKLQGELNALKNSDTIIIRTSWLYSKYGNNFVKSMLRLGKERDEIGVIYDQVGTPTCAADLAKCVLDIIASSEQNNSWQKGIYHFSNEGVCSWFDFALEIMQQANLDCKVKPIESHEYPVAAHRPPYSVLNKAKIKTIFGLSIPYWKTSLNNTLKHLI